MHAPLGSSGPGQIRTCESAKAWRLQAQLHPASLWSRSPCGGDRRTPRSGLPQALRTHGQGLGQTRLCIPKLHSGQTRLCIPASSGVLLETYSSTHLAFPFVAFSSWVLKHLFPDRKLLLTPETGNFGWQSSLSALRTRSAPAWKHTMESTAQTPAPGRLPVS